MKTGGTISRELISHIVRLEEKNQDKVLAYVKKLLKESGMNADSEEEKMNRRAAASESDIAKSRVKEASTFKHEFERWKKEKRKPIR